MYSGNKKERKISRRTLAAACPPSREAVQAGAEQLKALREKRWDTIEILAPPSLASLLWNLLS